MLGCSLMPFQSPLCSPPPTHLLTKYGPCIMCVNISAHYILTIKHYTILFQNLLDPLWSSAGRDHCPRFVFSPGFVASSCPSRGRDPYLHTYGQTLACKYKQARDANTIQQQMQIQAGNRYKYEQARDANTTQQQMQKDATQQQMTLLKGFPLSAQFPIFTMGSGQFKVTINHKLWISIPFGT